MILVGNLGKDPEIRYLDNGRAVCNFSLATSETYKNKEGQRVTNTEWHNVVLWTPLAEIAEKYLKKGGQVYIEGKIANRSYEDKEGITRYITEVVGREMTLLGKKPDSEESNSSAAASPSVAAPAERKAEVVNESITLPEDDSDDLPF